MDSSIQSPDFSAINHSWTHSLVLPFGKRSFRVILLIALIAAMSMVDLYLTILYVTHSGMNEVNPIARAMMEYQSPAILGIWKLATVALGVGILAFIRHRRSAEMGAWIGCLILGLLMSHWVAYIEEHSRMTQDPIQINALGDPSWVFFEPSAAGSRIDPRQVIP
ncbi:MAG: DUF5658 family protein [Phycisphaerales bacterium]